VRAALVCCRHLVPLPAPPALPPTPAYLTHSSPDPQKVYIALLVNVLTLVAVVSVIVQTLPKWDPDKLTGDQAEFMTTLW